MDLEYKVSTRVRICDDVSGGPVFLGSLEGSEQIWNRKCLHVCLDD